MILGAGPSFECPLREKQPWPTPRLVDLRRQRECNAEALQNLRALAESIKEQKTPMALTAVVAVAASFIAAGLVVLGIRRRASATASPASQPAIEGSFDLSSSPSQPAIEGSNDLPSPSELEKVTEEMNKGKKKKKKKKAANPP